jgi:glycosyltransferase involved in cell wall biosynthesis
MTRHLRVGVVTAYPPSTATLNEYGHHLVRHLAAKPEVAEIILLCDDAQGIPTDVPGNCEVVPCWRYGKIFNPLRVAWAIRRTQPDVVLFNSHFTSFGTGRISATTGLATPALTRALGTPCSVLMHNIVEAVDLETAGFSRNRTMTRILTWLGSLVTRLVLCANRVTVTIPQYVEIIRSKYGADHVFLTPHGCFDMPPGPEFSDEGPRRLLAFGKWGTYKKVEDLIASYRLLLERGHDGLELMIAGSDSHNAPGYLDSARQANRDLPGLTFTGYVDEADVPSMFGDSTVAVFPYTSTTGSSGVLHQAGSFGCPVALPAIGDFVDLVEEEGFVAAVFAPGDPHALADTLDELLRDPERRRAMAARNFAAATGLPLDDVADWHLHHLTAIAQAA